MEISAVFLQQGLGYTSSDPINTVYKWESIVHPDDVSQYRSMLEKYKQGELELYEPEFRVKTSTGEYLWVREMGESIKRDISTGNPLSMVGLLYNIDSRKKQMITSAQHRVESKLLNIISEIASLVRTKSEINDERILGDFLSKVSELIPFDRVFYFRDSEVVQGLRVVYEHNNNENSIAMMPLLKTTGLDIMTETSIIFASQDFIMASSEGDIKQLPWGKDNKEYFTTIFIKMKTKSLVMLPVVQEGNIVGVMAYQTLEDHYRWAEDEIRALQTISNLFEVLYVIATNKTDNQEEEILKIEERVLTLQQVVDQERKLSSCISRFVTARDWEDFEVILSETFAALFPLSEGIFYGFQEDGSVQDVKRWGNADACRSMSQCEIMRFGKIREWAQTDSAQVCKLGRHTGLCKQCCVPLYQEGRIVVVIRIDWREPPVVSQEQINRGLDLLGPQLTAGYMRIARSDVVSAHLEGDVVRWEKYMKIVKTFEEMRGLSLLSDTENLYLGVVGLQRLTDDVNLEYGVDNKKISSVWEEACQKLAENDIHFLTVSPDLIAIMLTSSSEAYMEELLTLATDLSRQALARLEIADQCDIHAYWVEDDAKDSFEKTIAKCYMDGEAMSTLYA